MKSKDQVKSNRRCQLITMIQSNLNWLDTETIKDNAMPKIIEEIPPFHHDYAS